MRRICFTLRVRPERMEEYKKRHRSVWPEMLDALRESGWTNYSLFLTKEGLLIGYLETRDFASAQRAMASREINRRWQLEMAAFFEDSSPLSADGELTTVEEVFHLT